jgi:hypothetical protein
LYIHRQVFNITVNTGHTPVGVQLQVDQMMHEDSSGMIDTLFVIAITDIALIKGYELFQIGG